MCNRGVTALDQVVEQIARERTWPRGTSRSGAGGT
jgi:hypothetical protein